MARKLGVRTPLDVNGAYVPSIGLGSIAVTPLDMASAYATFAARRRLLEADGDHEGDPRQGPGGHEGRLGQARAQARDLRRRRVRGDEDPRRRTCSPAPASARTSAGPPPARRARPRITPTRGSRGYTPQLEASVWVGYQRAEIPMYERARHLGRGRNVPGDDLEPLHEQGAREQDSDSDFSVPYRYPTFHDWHGRVAVHAAARPTRRRPTTPTPRRRRTTSQTNQVRSRVALAAGARRSRPHDGCRSARVAGRVAARAAERRPSGRRLDAAPGSSSRCSPRRSPPTSRASCSRARRRRVSPPCGAIACAIQLVAARRAAAALDRRVDVLGLRPDRDGARREPVSRAPSDYPDDPAFPYVGTAWRDTTTVYGPAFTLASEPLARRGRDVGRRGGVDLQVARRASPCSRAAALASRALAAAVRSRCSSSAGTRCSPCISRGGGHNDAWVALLVLACARRGGRGPAAARRASAGPRRARQVGSARAAAAARARGARDTAAGSATSASPLAARRRSPASRSSRYGTGWLHAFGPLARNANHETQLGAAAPARAARACRTALAIALFGARVRRRVRVARARGVARPRAPRPRDVRAAARAAVPRRLVRRVGGAARGRGGRRAARRCSRSCICAYLLRQTIPL